MIGTIFNTCMILGGSILGSLFKKGMKEKYHEILMQALGLAVGCAWSKYSGEAHAAQQVPGSVHSQSRRRQRHRILP